MRAKTLLLAAVGMSALCAGQALADDAGAPTVSELVVTGAPYAVSLDSATTHINIITQEHLATAAPVGIGDLLNGMPGIRSTAYSPGASRPIIRGLSGPRVMILQNGVGLVDASSLSPDHAVASDPGEASRIEILRGPSTLAHGGSAIGGVVNMLDERVPSTPASGGADGHVGASYGSVDDSYSVSAGLKAGKGPWVVALDAVRRESGDYDAPVNPVSSRYEAANGVTALADRVVRNTAVDLTAYGAGLSYVGAAGYIGASVKRTETSYGVPFAQIVQVGPPPEEGPVFIDLKQTRYDLRGETALDLGPFDKARVSVGYADYEHQEIAVDGGAVGTTFLSKGAEGRLELVQREHDGWKGAVGVQILGRDFEALGGEAFIPPVEISEVGAFVLQRLDRDGWGVEGGLRIDTRTLDAKLTGRPTSDAAAGYGVNWAAAAGKQDFTNASVSVSVFWRPASDWFLGLSLAHNARAPTEFELFADGPHGGTGSYEIGDPTLDAEQVTSLEATLRWTGANGKIEAHIYSADYTGFIDEARTGDLVDDAGVLDPAGELPVVRFIQSDARFYGGELEGTYDVWRHGDGVLALEGSYDYVHGQTDAGPPARIPPYSVTGRVVWTAPRLEGQVEVRYVAEQDRLSAFELTTDAYTLLSARVSYRPLADQDVKVFLDGRNLTNEQAREHTSFLKDIAPLPGRTVRAGVTYSF
ncbi:MAG: TonB-dependent receptor [Phenylobacterium sp.]|uniref:TonB-dependent receptor n=1 Tax=Phenylobacterium sp. TaxID=1871053 RepID=UPI001B716232|nr:TonB-dependent receptor [Phenylobacterium sp.]MBP7814671.1 TonB-dependent receptor [Phenylobacterium sp.]MBP9754879.1 TonB-dependent receptor [Phenylobacterium sp.]